MMAARNRIGNGPRRSRLWLLVLGCLALVLAGCNGDDIASLPEATPTAPPDVLLAGQLDIAFVEGYLGGYGFASIGTVDNSTVTPTLAELQAYDVVLVWTDGSALDPVALGDVLADYVDAGGAVVIATFGLSAQNTLQGRILTSSYTPLAPVSSFYLDDSLGTILVPAHPVMSGVTALTGHFRDETTPNAGAVVLAEWATSGAPVAAVNASGDVIGITLAPHSTFNLSGDYARLFANALYYVY